MSECSTNRILLKTSGKCAAEAGGRKRILASTFVVRMQRLHFSLQWRSLASCLRMCADCALPSHAYRRRRPRGCLRKQCEVFLSQSDLRGLRNLPTISALFFQPMKR